jgi:hypothetical protein
MAYQHDTLHNVIARAVARDEALSEADITYLGTQIALCLATFSGYSAEAEQVLTYDGDGVFEWVTGLTAEVDTAATPTLSVNRGVITAAAA